MMEISPRETTVTPQAIPAGTPVRFLAGFRAGSTGVVEHDDGPPNEGRRVKIRMWGGGVVYDIIGNLVILRPEPPASPDFQPGNRVEFTPSPTLEDVAAGAVRWEQQDPQNRRAHFGIRGHVATITVTISPFSEARVVRFFRPYPADAVVCFVDGAVLAKRSEPTDIGVLTFAGEETGETD